MIFSPILSASNSIAVLTISRCSFLNLKMSLINIFLLACSNPSFSLRIFPFLTNPCLFPCSQVPYVVHVTIYPRVLLIRTCPRQRLRCDLAPTPRGGGHLNLVIQFPILNSHDVRKSQRITQHKCT